MTVHEFFIKRAIVFAFLIVIGLGVLAYKTFFQTTEPIVSEPTTTIPEPTASVQLPTFTWSYEADDSLNPDGNPQTNVFLSVRYPNGITKRSLIDTTQGSCNELYEAELDSVAGSANIQCYYAGLGYVFKITKGEKAYLVQRKEFEEASPDYEPVVTGFKIILEIPLN
jgi:hypothetical protein